MNKWPCAIFIDEASETVVEPGTEKMLRNSHVLTNAESVLREKRAPSSFLWHKPGDTLESFGES